MQHPKEKIVRCPVCSVKIVVEQSGIVSFHMRWNDERKNFEKCPGIGREVAR